MKLLKFLPYVLKQITRHRVRSLLTIAGIAVAMFLFTAVQAMNQGVSEATQATAKDTTLVVYREDRYCPATSELPQDYQRRIEDIQGVVSAVPIKVVVSNCRTSLDVVTFRGVPKDAFIADRKGGIELVDGSVEEWKRRTDAALVGETLANRRGLKPGMTFDAAVDVDEYVTTFGNGTVDGSEYVLTSALKKVDVGIVDAVNCFLYDWESCAGKNNMMSAANDGVGMAPCHEACEVYDETIQKQVDDLFMALKDNAISTGVDAMGDIIELDEVILGRRRRLMMLNRPSDLVL